MFAAFQKASKSAKAPHFIPAWNWVPIPVSRDQTTKEIYQDSSIMAEPLNIDSPKQSVSEWVEVPLSSDDEDNVSPRGILQFRKISEGESGERVKGGEDIMETRSNHLCVAAIKHYGPLSIGAWEENTSNLDKNKEMKSVISESDTSNDSGDVYSKQRTRQTTQLHSRRSHNLEISSVGQDLSRSGKIRKVPSMESEQQYAKLEDSLQQSTEKRDGNLKDNGLAVSHHAETQTPSTRDDFSSTKLALQRQLADALGALDLTRNQANALRDRLHTYTSSMKQQANDLRTSSKTLCHALDKAKEYRTNWKREEKLKEEAKNEACKLDSKAKSLQRAIDDQNSEMKNFSLEVNNLNKLLGVEKTPRGALEKLAIASTKVEHLLDLVEKVQAEAAIASAVSTVELKESLRKFEEEKASWIAFTNFNDDIFTGKIRKLEMKNEDLKTQINTLKESSTEIKALLKQARHEGDDKQERLRNTESTVRDLENTLTRTQAELHASVTALESQARQQEELRLAFRNENWKLEVEKRKIEVCLADLKRDLAKNVTNQKDQSVHCNLNVGDDQTSFAGHYSDATVELLDSQALQSPLRSTNYSSEHQFRENETERNSLQREADELRRVLVNVKTELFDNEQEYIRLRGDFRQLNWTSHHQQVTIQRVRAENKSLRVSISKLRRGRGTQKSDVEVEQKTQETDVPVELNRHTQHTEQRNDLTNTPNESSTERPRSLSGSSSDNERNRLQTIPESSDECPFSSPGMSPSNSIALLDTSATSGVVPTPTAAAQIVHAKRFSLEESDGNLKSGLEEIMTSRSPSDSTWASTRKSDTSSTVRRKRLRKSKHKEKLRLPIWRQENPDNHFSFSQNRREYRSESVSSVGSEDVFVSSSASRTREESSRSEQENTIDFPIVTDQPSRLVGIPMPEKEFEKLLGSLDYNDLTPIALPTPRQRIPFATGETSLNDDGYSSSVAELLETNRNFVNGDPLHSTLLFPNLSTSSSETAYGAISESEARHCFVSYGGVTFDVMTFDITQMRQIAWEAGFADSENGMNKFIDFLAEIAQELDEDPKWKGKHSLGKSSDWLSLKGLLS